MELFDVCVPSRGLHFCDTAGKIISTMYRRGKTARLYFKGRPFSYVLSCGHIFVCIQSRVWIPRVSRASISSRRARLCSGLQYVPLFVLLTHTCITVKACALLGTLGAEPTCLVDPSPPPTYGEHYRHPPCRQLSPLRVHCSLFHHRRRYPMCLLPTGRGVPCGDHPSSGSET